MSYIGNQPYTAAFLVDTKSGDGTTTAFTLTIAPANTSSCIVAITGVLQDPSTYSVSGTTLTFSAAPPSGTSNISVRYLGIPASGVTTTAYRTVTEFTATSGQTSFSVPSYTVGYIDVYRNGVMLGTADFTATTGTTVVLASGATTGDLIRTESFYVSSVLNALPSTGGTLTGNLVVTGTETVPTITSPTSTALTLQTNNGTTAVTIDTSQNVSVGSATNTTYGKLSVFNAQSDGNQTIANSGILFANSVGGQFAQAAIWPFGSSGFAGSLLFGTSPSGSGTFTPTERMRIASDGKVFVGTGTDFTDNPQQGLILYAANNNSQLVVCHGSGTSSGTYFAKFDYNASTIGTITQNGTTAVAYNTSSDYRLKENIAPLTGALNKVALLKPVTYTWKASPEETGEGFIAHELAEVCPQAVHGTKDEVNADGNPVYQGIDTSFLVATLTAAIQELKAELDELKAKVG